MDIVSYALSRKYTEETAIEFGALKGASCTIKSIVKEDGHNTITFEWKNSEGETRTSVLVVDDGTPIYIWHTGDSYEVGDLCIYQASFYQCVIANNDGEFNPAHWLAIGSADSNYGIVELASELPSGFTIQDRKMYYSIADHAFWLWDGEEWVLQERAITNAEINALFE